MRTATITGEQEILGLTLLAIIDALLHAVLLSALTHKHQLDILRSAKSKALSFSHVSVGRSTNSHFGEIIDYVIYITFFTAQRG